MSIRKYRVTMEHTLVYGGDSISFLIRDLNGEFLIGQKNRT